MASYILRRLFLLVPTLIGILTLNFFLVQAAPGGPVDRMLVQLQGQGGGHMERIAGSAGGDMAQSGSSRDASLARGVDPEILARIETMYGFDRPLSERYLDMLWDYAQFDLGESFLQDRQVSDLILDKMPVSISLGLWTTALTYLVSIPLGIRKAVRQGSRFDIWSSAFIVLAHAIPMFLLAIVLVILFAGGSYWQIFPLRGLLSPGWETLGPLELALDYLWHLVLPVGSMVVGSLATLTFLTRNSFLDELGKQYVQTARAKGLGERRVLYGHVFRNAMLIVISGFPAAFIGAFFTGSLLIEIIFSLDGLGLLGFESTLNRDYPVMFGTLYVFTLLGLLANLLSDLSYTLIDPRIHFGRRELGS